MPPVFTWLGEKRRHTMISKVLTAAAMPGRVFLVDAMRLLARRLRKLPTALAHRDQLRRLAGSDDDLLADIGVTRGDIDTALSTPLWCDPTAELAHRLNKLKTGEQRQPIRETSAGIRRPAVSSPELILAACNRRRVPIARA